MIAKGMRAEVTESWFRSAAAGVGAGMVDAPITLPGDSLPEHREAHPLAQVFPLLNDILGQTARDCDAIMAVSDAAGQLLWIRGSPTVRRDAESIGFVEGSNWDERLAGTNAPGMALALNQSVRVVGVEHFRRSMHRWSCAATPIHDPFSAALLGVLDITGAAGAVIPQTMAMVRAIARMAEAELARAGVSRPVRSQRQAPGMFVVMESLGRSESLLTIHDGRGKRRSICLSPRHSEILLIIASAARGLSGEELTARLYEGNTSVSTLRAELNRLRSILGEELLGSRPYRLMAELAADWLAVEAHLAVGDVAAAMRTYRGPLLPSSTAPGVVRLREDIEASLRQAVLDSREPNVMSSWTRSAWGVDDYDMWCAQLNALGATSPLRPLAAGQVARLDRELGHGVAGAGVGKSSERLELRPRSSDLPRSA